MDWLGTFKAKFRNNAEAATPLRKEWMRVAPKEAKRVKEPSLATQIGTLRGGDASWWTKRPLLQQALADLLGLEVSQIFDSGSSLDGAIAFREFRHLPPIARGELPCRLSHSGWILDVITRASRAQLAWVVAPEGWGKSLAIEWLRTNRSEEVATATAATLAGAVSYAGTRLPLVIEIECADIATDARAAASLATRKAVTVVLAPFPRPFADDELGPSDTVPSPKWQQFDARAMSGWRRRLVSWISARLEDNRDTKLIDADVIAWLEEHDPDEKLVASPGDLVALCADFDAHGAVGATWRDRALRWLRDTAPTLFPAEVPPTWVRRLFADTAGGMIVAHFERMGEAFGALPAERWATAIPRDLGAADERSQLGALQVVAYLRDAGILRGSTEGLTLYPTWVRTGLVAGRVERACLEGPAESWGRWAADATRQALVDTALDELNHESFVAVVRRVGSAPRATLANFGAIDATCAAAARRFWRPGFSITPKESAVWAELFRRALGSLVPLTAARVGEPGQPEERLPYTRRSREEWLATAWTLSMRLPKPQDFDAGDMAWVVPGWADSLPLSATGEERFVHSRVDHEPHPRVVLRVSASAAVQRIAWLSVALIEKMEAHDVPLSVPRLLLPAVVLGASSRGWKLASEHLRHLRDSWESQFLAELAPAQTEKIRRSIAEVLWHLVARDIDAAADAPVAERLARLRDLLGHLRWVVVENLSDDIVEKTARACGIARRNGPAGSYVPSDPHELLDLQSSARAAALKGWLAASSGAVRFDEARQLIPIVAAGESDLAIELIRETGDPAAAAEWVAVVWQRSPERAREEALSALRDGRPSAHGWMHGSPREELPVLVDELTSLPVMPPWAPAWAFGRALNAGEASEKVFAIAAGAGQRAAATH